MAKAQFHKSQRVYVKPVGTWALIEHVVPHWAKGLDEPIRIHYDVGLGREFAAEELLNEEPLGDKTPGEAQAWRVVRARNKWQPAEDCARHPVPGTYPVVVTGDDGTEAIAIHSMGLLCLSWDHRAVDGAYAAAFVAQVAQMLVTRDWAAEL